MTYDVIGGGTIYEPEPSGYTIGSLIEVCKENPTANVVFVDTDYTVGDLHSWRGVYDLPAISYKTGTKNGKQVAEELEDSLDNMHHGWKGGEYYYNKDDVFYVAQEGRAEEYQVVGTAVVDGVLVLYTKIVPW